MLVFILYVNVNQLKDLMKSIRVFFSPTNQLLKDIARFALKIKCLLVFLHNSCEN